MPIIEQHSIAYEQLKFEAEEKLQKVIEDINVLITDMYPLLVILDEMDNIKLARKYLNKITLHMTKIKVRNYFSLFTLFTTLHLASQSLNFLDLMLSYPLNAV